MTSCPNCGGVVEGSFCPSCGQRQGDLLPTTLEWVAALLDELFFVNRKVPRDLGTILTRPGALTKDWVEGRRAQHISPLRLYLAAAITYFILKSLFMPHGTGVLEGLLAGLESPGWVIENTSEYRSEALRRAGAVQVLRDNWSSLVLLLMVPTSALVLKGRSWDKPRFVEHLVFSLHVHAFVFVCLLVLMPLMWISAELGTGIGLLTILGYAGLAVHRHYEAGCVSSVMTVAVLLLVYVTVFYLFAIAAGNVISRVVGSA